MTTELEKELINHIIDKLEYLDDIKIQELHYYCFNEDYYIIGYYQASEWLQKHGIDAFECIDYVQEYENSNFGETNTKINSEAMVNMYIYIKGEELINSLDLTKSKKSIIKQLKGMM